MKESSQTLAFLAAALAAVLAAIATRPGDATLEVSDLIGRPLFTPFEPDEATSMRIVRFNEESATLREFEVAEEDGVWSIPSKGGYPADAGEQMAEATTGVTNLEILQVAAESAAEHADYGVVEPSSNLEVGQTGVGARVELKDEDGDTLVDVIIGKEVKDADDQHYVRKPTQDVVYVVEIDPESFSTKFEEWIEDDLLDLNPWDIARVRVKDYSSQLVLQGFREAIAIDPRADLTVAYDDGESAWQPVELLAYDRDAGDYAPFTLDEGTEQLADEALDDLKNAVGDLRIVDVERKPTGLSSDLKAGKALFDNRAALTSLTERGFAPGPGDDGEVYSTEGEVIVSTKEGVEYVLRFGDLQLSAADDSQSPDAEAEEDADADEGVNRYLFVMARFNPDLVEGPELEEVPPASDEEAADDEDDAEAETDSQSVAETEGAAEDANEDANEDDAEANRELILKRNQREQERYEEQLADGRKRVNELNERFGDWYYVIADSVYEKIALGRDDLIVAKEPEEGEDDPAVDPVGDPGAAIPGLPEIPGATVDPFDAATVELADESLEDAAEEGSVEAATGE